MNHKTTALLLLLISNSFISPGNYQQESNRQANDWLISGEKYTSRITPSASGK